MTEDFIKVEKYKCKYCGKCFSTTRHDCKWNPNKGNCLSCKHCVGFTKGKGAIYDSYTLGYVDNDPSYFRCALDVDGYNDIGDLANYNWSLGCDYYEKAESDNYRKRYGELIITQRAEEMANFQDEYNSWRGMKF